jgi:DNA processing protein
MNDEIRLLTRDEFPPALLEIPDPPKKLYVRGQLPDPLAYAYLAVVGTRTYTPYGKAVCEKLIAGLAGYPVVIVSGLALGIDGVAHQSALSAGLKTVAVPGSGLDDRALYPSTHRALAREIIAKGGALISEFEPEFRATTWSFPVRNRIMAGLTRATLVIEAAIKSGSLITSRLATEYNRDVLAVPGSIFSPGSSGPHMLLTLGAKPATKSRDILQTLGFNTEGAADANRFAKALEEATDDERRILELLGEPTSREELIRMTDFPVSQANTILTVLEIKGVIKEELGLVRVNI